VCAADGELQVEIRPAKPKHGTVKTSMVRKACKLFQTKALLVLRDGVTQVAHRTCDSQINAHCALGEGVAGRGLTIATAAHRPCRNQLGGHAYPSICSACCFHGLGNARSSRHAFSGLAVAEAMRSTRCSLRSTTTFMQAQPWP